MRADFDHLRVFVGSDTINHYTGAEHAPLVVGKERLSYFEVAKRTGLPAGRTVRIISNIATDHAAKSLTDLYQKSSPSSIASSEFGAGVGTLLMLFRLFESEGLDIRAWARRGKNWLDEKGKDDFTNFITYKKREQAGDRNTARTPASGPREKGFRKAAMKAEKKNSHKGFKLVANG